MGEMMRWDAEMEMERNAYDSVGTGHHQLSMKKVLYNTTKMTNKKRSSDDDKRISDLPTKLAEHNGLVVQSLVPTTLTSLISNGCVTISGVSVP